MRFVVFECRKCGHNLYVENTEDVVKNVGRVSNSDCPNCGEEPDGNWLLVGLRKEFPNEERRCGMMDENTLFVSRDFVKKQNPHPLFDEA